MDPREEYEDAIKAAWITCWSITNEAYRVYETALDQAWYTYQVRVGELQVIAAQEQEGASDGDSASHEGHRDGDPVPGEQPATSEDGSEDGSTSAEDTAEADTADAAAPQHPRRWRAGTDSGGSADSG